MALFGDRFMIGVDVFPFLEGPDLLTLSQVHTDFRDRPVRLGALVEGAHEMMNCSDSFDGLITAAARSGRRDICELACDWLLKKKHPVDWALMIQIAAGVGSRDICDFVRHRTAPGTSYLPTNPSRRPTSLWGFMFLGAVQGCNRGRACELAKFARDWSIAEQCPLHVGWMLQHAVANNHVAICQMVRQWTIEEHYNPGVPNWNMVFRFALEHGHRDICRLAISWGSTMCLEHPDDDREPEELISPLFGDE